MAGGEQAHGGDSWRAWASWRWQDGAERATKLVAEAEVTVRGCRRGTDERRGQARGSPLRALARPRDTGGGNLELDPAADGWSLASALPLRTGAGASGGEGCGGRRQQSRGEGRGGSWWLVIRAS